MGLYNLYCEHPKCASDKICVLIALLFNCMVIYGHLSSEFMDTIIVPFVKDKQGDLSSSDNYRPIAITSIMSKEFELLILDG